MPFITEFAGPQRPVTSWPVLGPGMRRRTSTIDTHQGDAGTALVELRARDAVADGSGGIRPVDDVVLRARLLHGSIDTISGDPRLNALRGSLVGAGFRGRVGALLESDVERATLVHLLLDDWVGANLVTGYGIHHSMITDGGDMPIGVGDHLAGICSGFAHDASAVEFTRTNRLMPCVRGPLAPDLGPMHPVDALRPHGMRRMRRLDVDPAAGSFDAHFRDSHVDGAGTHTIVHEYTLTGAFDVASRTVSRVEPVAHVLPWQECPGALASAARIRGVPISALRNKIRTEFVGVSTCTHLNDMLRCLGDVEPLLGLVSATP